MTPAEMRRRAAALEAEADALIAEACEMEPLPCRCPRRCPRSCPSRQEFTSRVNAHELRAEELRDEAEELREDAGRLAAPVPLRPHVRQMVSGWREARAKELRRSAEEQRRWAAEDAWGREGRLWTAAELERQAAEEDAAARAWMAA